MEKVEPFKCPKIMRLIFNRKHSLKRILSGCHISMNDLSFRFKKIRERDYSALLNDSLLVEQTEMPDC